MSVWSAIELLLSLVANTLESNEVLLSELNIQVEVTLLFDLEFKFSFIFWICHSKLRADPHTHTYTHNIQQIHKSIDISSFVWVCMCVCHYFGGYLHNFIPVLPHNLSVSQYPFVKSGCPHITQQSRMHWMGCDRHRPPTQRYIKLTASLHRSMNVSKWLLKGINQFREKAGKQRLPSLNYGFLLRCLYEGAGSSGSALCYSHADGRLRTVLNSERQMDLVQLDRGKRLWKRFHRSRLFCSVRVRLSDLKILL